MEKEFFSQQELAERWCCSDTKIKTARQKGLIPWMPLPDSDRKLYPVSGIIEYEQSKIKGGDKVKKLLCKQGPELLSVPSIKKWRAEY